MSKIDEAAVKLRDGRIVTGSTHREAWGIVVAGNGYTQPRGAREGFMTDDGRFVNRFTAATIARSAGQVPHGVADPKHGLSSGDLY